MRTQADLQKRLKEIDDKWRRRNRRLSLLSAGCYTAGAIGFALIPQWWLVALAGLLAVQQVVEAVRS